MSIILIAVLLLIAIVTGSLYVHPLLVLLVLIGVAVKIKTKDINGNY